MKLIRRICLRLAKWTGVDFAEGLKKREQKAVSLERATEEYEGVVAQSICDGTFGSVLWGKNHMPDDCLRHHMDSILKQCATTEHPNMKNLLLVDSLFVDRPIVKTGRGSPRKFIQPKPPRVKVDGKWPIDENVGAIHVSGSDGKGKHYSTPLSIQQFLKELADKTEVEKPVKKAKKPKKTTKKVAKKKTTKRKAKKTPARRKIAA